jgi:hypothetical protein
MTLKREQAEMKPDEQANSLAGKHPFRDHEAGCFEHDAWFEVLWHDDGWYWGADTATVSLLAGTPLAVYAETGPFDTSVEAYDDAQTNLD